MVQTVLKVLTYSNLKISAQPHDEISIVLTDKSTITELNKQYLKHNGATDVITFDYCQETGSRIDSEEVTLGEIFICTEVAAEVCRSHGNSVSVEVILYVIHGILHLCGYDDQNDIDRKEIRHMEAKLLTQLNDQYDLEGFIE